MNFMSRDHNFDKNFKKLTAKSAKLKSVEAQPVRKCENVHVCFYICVCASLVEIVRPSTSNYIFNRDFSIVLLLINY